MKEETAVAVEGEEAPVTLAQCKCQAFEQIRTDLMDVVEMICPSDRMPMNTGSISPILIWYWYNQCWNYRNCNFWNTNKPVFNKPRDGPNCIFCSGTIDQPLRGDGSVHGFFN